MHNGGNQSLPISWYSLQSNAYSRLQGHHVHKDPHPTAGNYDSSELYSQVCPVVVHLVGVTSVPVAPLPERRRHFV